MAEESRVFTPQTLLCIGGKADGRSLTIVGDKVIVPANVNGSFVEFAYHRRSVEVPALIMSGLSPQDVVERLLRVYETSALFRDETGAFRL